MDRWTYRGTNISSYSWHHYEKFIECHNCDQVVLDCISGVEIGVQVHDNAVISIGSEGVEDSFMCNNLHLNDFMWIDNVVE